MKQGLSQESIRDGRTGPVSRPWPLVLGISGTAIATAALAWGAITLYVGGTAADHTDWQSMLQRGLHGAFLLIAVGAVLRMRKTEFLDWRWTVDVALTVLALAVAGEAATALAQMGWFPDIEFHLGADDNLERRLFRLGSMAAFAVPMLALLAAREQKPAAIAGRDGTAAVIATLLVRFEPWLFAIGAAALPGFLVAAAVVNREIAWLAPIGADTTFAACVAATIRAHRRNDRMAYSGWLIVSTSMGFGLLMGAYAFDGPLPPPAFIGDYGALTRTIVRDAHVLLMCAGIIAISVSTGAVTRARS